MFNFIANPFLVYVKRNVYNLDTFSPISLQLKYRATFPGAGGREGVRSRGHGNGQCRQAGERSDLPPEPQTPACPQDGLRDEPGAAYTAELNGQGQAGRQGPALRRGCGSSSLPFQSDDDEDKPC